MARSKKMPTKGELKSRLGAMADVAKQVKGFSPGREVLTSVQAHPTIFPKVDEVTGVGGWPLQRIAVVHGPSNHGKTLFTHGLGQSFLNSMNFYAFIDAEFTTPADWMQSLLAENLNHPGFIAMRPKSFEETVQSVRSLANAVAEKRENGDLGPDATGLIVVDSIRKLVPKGLLTKMLKGDHGFDGAKGRGAQMKAALNAQWMDELVPLMHHSNMSIVFIAREYDKEPDTKSLQDPSKGFDYAVGGGKSLIYESSLVCRVTRGWVKEGSGDNARVVGEKHNVAITKTKVSAKSDKVVKGYFHTSNGISTPAGFDRARDVFEMAKEQGVLKLKGSWYMWGDQKWQGEAKLLTAMRADQGMLDTLEGEVR